MDRRTFLTRSMTIAGGLGASAMASNAATAQDTADIAPRQITIAPDAHFITEPVRQTPVVANVDVLVVGGGPAGVGAALAAASQGAKTLLLERHGMLGGMWTAGLLNPLFDPHKGWLVDQLIAALKAKGAWVTKGMDVFDTETMKYVLEQMLAQTKADFQLYCPATEPIVAGDCVRGVIVENKSGREAILARVLIDCTGDGDIAARAGAPFEMGRASDGLCQPMTLMFEISGYRGFRDLSADQLTSHQFFRDLQRVIDEEHLPIRLPYGPQRSGTPYLIALPGKAVAVVQATHVYRAAATDARQLSQATVEARRQVHEIFLPAMRRIPGLEDLRLCQTAPQIGIRESRRITGRYHLELEDLFQARRFPDAVTSIGFHVDLHELDPQDTKPKLPPFPPGVTRHTITKCDIPYRCLLPKGRTGLLVAGRCISGSHEAHAAYRVTGTCMAMGQAAGLAAALAVQKGVSPDQLDGQELHRALVERGVKFLPRNA